MWLSSRPSSTPYSFYAYHTCTNVLVRRTCQDRETGCGAKEWMICPSISAIVGSVLWMSSCIAAINYHPMALV